MLLTGFCRFHYFLPSDWMRDALLGDEQVHPQSGVQEAPEPRKRMRIGLVLSYFLSDAVARNHPGKSHLVAPDKAERRSG
jgi:hypothetical protein